MRDLVEKLEKNRTLGRTELKALLGGTDAGDRERLFSAANRARLRIFGDGLFVRGLIEFTNHCKNDCYYCGIRRGNGRAVRYRLDEDEILACCERGYALGFRTFVIQGGEDPLYGAARVEALVRRVRGAYGDCAISLSLGEADRGSYERWFEAGADRYLLRHETAGERHYAMLHPRGQTLANRKRCLFDLKDIGYQTGAGFMVGSPFQTLDDIVEDLKFIEGLRPHMVGVGPFIPHADTRYRDMPAGGVELTLAVIAVLRLMDPWLLIPATTALGTAAPDGRERGVMAGANVLMPNLSPPEHRRKYALYDNKICVGEEAAECRGCLSLRMATIGCRLLCDRGDYAGFGQQGGKGGQEWTASTARRARAGSI
ncbi:MAG: [FeFe] hydrogenase H-cluster radical SAM maturase HydE [Clostridiales Family XIII bacterium]|jgi:biotin synthase|nr:[FeFe] hydrogenase H-cluster radical SAM maturase HydE [Clostridiales Family XIII bacterium]